MLNQFVPCCHVCRYGLHSQPVEGFDSSKISEIAEGTIYFDYLLIAHRFWARDAYCEFSNINILLFGGGIAATFCEAIRKQLLLNNYVQSFNWVVY